MKREQKESDHNICWMLRDGGLSEYEIMEFMKSKNGHYDREDKKQQTRKEIKDENI